MARGRGLVLGPLGRPLLWRGRGGSRGEGQVGAAGSSAPAWLLSWTCPAGTACQAGWGSACTPLVLAL